EKLAKENRFDYLLIESTGISEPIPVAQTFSYVGENQGIDLSLFSYVDTMVTVVDCYNFFNDFGSAETLQDRELTDDDYDARTIVNLLTDQIEFANVILLNKMDLVADATIGLLEAAIGKLNPGAKIIRTHFGQVEPREIIGTGLFDFDTASSSAGWIRELEQEHIPETDEYGISSFVFRAQKPFHPQRWHTYLNADYPTNIIRAKGLFWIASRPDMAISFSQAGGSLRLEHAGSWWCSMPEESRYRYPEYAEIRPSLMARWHPEWEDRKTELVFIGQHLEKDQYITELEKCLLTEDEVEDWRDTWFKDPFPKNM
ncbi:MAG TPA: GTP-binding protein, partial [Sphingobacterium sp.]|nr:GTP-binding protein [Sphingobacterium sp.]